MTLDGWLCMQDVPMLSRCPPCRQPLLQRLFDTLLKQCTLPPHYAPSVADVAGHHGHAHAAAFHDANDDADDDDDDTIAAFRVGAFGLVQFSSVQSVQFSCTTGPLDSTRLDSTAA